MILNCMHSTICVHCNFLRHLDYGDWKREAGTRFQRPSPSLQQRKRNYIPRIYENIIVAPVQARGGSEKRRLGGGGGKERGGLSGRGPIFFSPRSRREKNAVP